MKPPKTAEEFMALPVRSQFRYREELRDGRTIRIPLRTVAGIVCTAPDTVFTCGGYVLAADEDGYYRRELLL